MLLDNFIIVTITGNQIDVVINYKKTYILARFLENQTYR